MFFSCEPVNLLQCGCAVNLEILRLSLIRSLLCELSGTSKYYDGITATGLVNSAAFLSHVEENQSQRKGLSRRVTKREATATAVEVVKFARKSLKSESLWRFHAACFSEIKFNSLLISRQKTRRDMISFSLPTQKTVTLNATACDSNINSNQKL